MTPLKGNQVLFGAHPCDGKAITERTPVRGLIENNGDEAIDPLTVGYPEAEAADTQAGYAAAASGVSKV